MHLYIQNAHAQEPIIPPGQNTYHIDTVELIFLLSICQYTSPNFENESFFYLIYSQKMQLFHCLPQVGHPVNQPNKTIDTIRLA